MMDSNVLFKEFPVLKSDKLTLGQIEDHHLEEVFEIYSNDNVFEYCGIIPKHKKDSVMTMIRHFKRDYHKKTRLKWGIFPDNQSNTLVGIIEAFEFNQRINKVTIGYFLAERHWGKGIASEAVNMVVRFLIEDAKVSRIQADVMPPNEVSKRVLLKNGFIKEGTLRQAASWSGKGIVDLEIYSLLKEDFQREN